MKENTLVVVINKSIDKVFEFTTDPKMTHEWISSISVEETNEWPARIGTIYRNRGESGLWSTYKVSKYVPNKEFGLVKQDDSTYHVNYSYSVSAEGTKLIYREWVTKGELEVPFTQGTLNQLKEKMEAKQN